MFDPEIENMKLLHIGNCLWQEHKNVSTLLLEKY